MQIIEQKIRNQSRALTILGVEGAEAICNYLNGFEPKEVDSREALAAKE
jgi:hypothetical protein